MTHTLMTLPFDLSSLEPHISKETIEYHYGKHHAGYVAKLNALIKDTKYEEMALTHIIKDADGAIFNNAAQVYNHDFYFNALTNKESAVSEELFRLINKGFVSQTKLKEAFIEASLGLFGAGWVWLCVDARGDLVIESFSNAENPLRAGHTPLLTCDVWEHAYYIDYRNARADYLQMWWNLINWDFVSNNLARAEIHNKSYVDPCLEDSELCDYVDAMQVAEHVST